MKTSPCFDKVKEYRPELSRLLELPEDMQRLWINTKLDQIELMVDCSLPYSRDTVNLLDVDAMLNIREKIKGYTNICCSVSGGSDSDVIIDLLARSTDRFKDIRFVFFDTGLEYSATKKHLEDLEQKYGISIERESSQVNPPLLQGIRTTVPVQEGV